MLDMQNLKTKPIRKAAVLGAGVMGAQIAAHLANAGLSVELLDIAGTDENRNSVVEEAFQRALKLRPNPFFSERTARQIQVGNFEDHLDRIAAADWVIEAVVEKVEVKQEIMSRVEAVASEDAVISTNTSGISMRLISKGRSDAFKRRFLGTHFFNPPRYLHLLEVIPGEETESDVVQRIVKFGRLNLGKGVVIAKDTPGFVGNRVGTFELMHSIHTWLEGAYSIEEIDALTGPLIGRPTSATFRTSDVIGLDTLVHIVDYLHSAVEGESRDVLVVPALMKNLIADGAFGAKVGRGFYKKEGAEILSINPKTMAYESATELDLGDLSTISRQIAVQDRIRSLYEDEGRAGAFTRNHVLKTLAFCARRIPEISDSPADIDRVMRWGFGWEIGPFEIWDALGIAQVVEDMSANGIDLPKWVTAMAEEEQPSFYCGKDQDRTVYVPVKGYAANPQPLDEIQLSVIASNPQQILWQNDDAVLLNLGNQVALYEFRSKANSLGHAVVGGILEVIDMIEEGDFRGLVIGNQGKHFSVGANLKEMMALQGKWNEMGELLVRFQTMIQRIHYAGKPVVVTTHGLVLGGGCEMAMASTHPVADAESCIGLVELGVGLIPAGCGTMRLAAYAHEQAPDEDENHIQAYLDRYLETLRLAKVSESAHQAQEMGLLPNHTRIVMNTDRRLYVAKEEVIRLSNQGYAPPPERNAIKVLGEPGRAHFEATTLTMMQDKLISEFDRYLAERLAWIMTGGDLTNSAYVHENYLMELEREVFLSLLGEEKTQARIESILTQNKLLRN